MQQTRTKTEIIAVLFASIILFIGLGIWWTLQEPSASEISSSATNSPTTKPRLNDTYTVVPEDKKDFMSNENSKPPNVNTEPTPNPFSSGNEAPQAAPKRVKCDTSVTVSNGIHTLQTIYSTNNRADPTRQNLVTNKGSGSSSLFTYSDPDVGGTSRVYDIDCSQMTTKQLEQQTNRPFIVYTDYSTSVVQAIQFIE